MTAPGNERGRKRHERRLELAELAARRRAARAGWPALPQTARYLAIRDRLEELLERVFRHGSAREAADAVEALEAVDALLGLLFGFETIKAGTPNSLETCFSCIRPGLREPGPGAELSYLRRAVAAYLKDAGKAGKDSKR